MSERVSEHAHTACAECNGRGFLRRGDFANRSFPRCPRCKGVGQYYHNPRPAPPTEPLQAMRPILPHEVKC